MPVEPPGRCEVSANLGRFAARTAQSDAFRFRFTGALGAARAQATAVPLSNGQILIVGGRGDNYDALANCEVHDPTTETYGVTGSMSLRRFAHTVTGLADGRVLVVGGSGSAWNQYDFVDWIA